MNRIEIEKGELPVTRHFESSKEGFIVSVMGTEESTFRLHIKISTDTGNIYNIVFPLKVLRPFKAII